MDEYKRTDKPIWYYIPDFESQYQSHIQSGILTEWEVQKCIKLSNGNNIDVYSLPFIVALSFRLETLGANRVREYVINKLTTNPRTDIVFICERACARMYMNKSKYRHN